MSGCELKKSVLVSLTHCNLNLWVWFFFFFFPDLLLFTLTLQLIPTVTKIPDKTI